MPFPEANADWPEADARGLVAEIATVRGLDAAAMNALVPVPAALGMATGPGSWPLQDVMQLDALPSAVPLARRHARHVLGDWGPVSLSERALVVSELVTNAVAAARTVKPASLVRLWLLADARHLLVLVWDACPALPVLAVADENAETGRGLLLVEAISRQWGSCRTPQAGGKIVWALCDADETDQPKPDCAGTIPSTARE